MSNLDSNPNQSTQKGGMAASNPKQYQLLAWFICSLGAVYYSYEYFLRIAPSVMVNALREHFNLSAAGFGLLSSFYYYAYVLMQVPVGVLMDRYGPKRLLTIACAICVIGTALFSGTSVFAIAAIGRFLVGLGSAFAFVGVLKLATLWLPEDKLAMVAGIASALGTIGAMVGDNLLGYMVTGIGWQNTLNISALLGLILTVVLWFGIQDHRRSHEIGGTVNNIRRNIIDLVIIARNPQIWINGLYGCLVYLPTTVFAELWGIPYLEHAHGLGASGARFANSMLFFGFTIGAPLMGYISDRLKRRKIPMQIGACGACLVMLTILYVPGLNQNSINVLMFCLGLLYSAQAIVFAVGRELSPPEAAGTAIAMTNMIVMIGAMFVQPLVGWLLDLSFSKQLSNQALLALPIDKMNQLYSAQDYQFAMAIIPLGILLAAILTLFLRETYAYINDEEQK